MPLVSIIMPNFNGSRYLELAIDSVRLQSFGDWELLVSDDGSTDSSSQIIERAADADHRIKLVPTSQARTGPAKTRNRAIALASGRYIAFLDSDDTWGLDKLSLQLALQNERRCAVTFTALRKMNAEGELSSRVVFPKAAVTYRQLLTRNYLPCSSVIVDRNMSGDFNMPDIFRRQDFALWLQLLRNGGVAYGHPAPLLSYRVYPQSFSASKIVSAQFHWKVLREHENISLPHAATLFTRYAIGAGVEYARGRVELQKHRD